MERPELSELENLIVGVQTPPRIALNKRLQAEYDEALASGKSAPADPSPEDKERIKALNALIKMFDAHVVKENTGIEIIVEYATPETCHPTFTLLNANRLFGNPFILTVRTPMQGPNISNPKYKQPIRTFYATIEELEDATKAALDVVIAVNTG